MPEATPRPASDPVRGAFERWGAGAFRLAGALLGDREQSLDVLCEGVAAARRRGGSSRETLLTTVHRGAVDRARLRGSRPSRAEVQARSRGVRLLDALPAPRREELSLTFLGGYTVDEVATITGASAAQVRAGLLASLRALQTPRALVASLPAD